MFVYHRRIIRRGSRGNEGRPIEQWRPVLLYNVNGEEKFLKVTEKTMRENRANSLQLELTIVELLKFWKISLTSLAEHTVHFPYCRDGVILMMSNLPTRHWTC